MKYIRDEKKIAIWLGNDQNSMTMKCQAKFVSLSNSIRCTHSYEKSNVKILNESAFEIQSSIFKLKRRKMNARE